MRLYIRSRTVSHGLSRSCTIANTIIQGNERDFMMSQSSDTQADVIEVFNLTSRYFGRPFEY